MTLFSNNNQKEDLAGLLNLSYERQPTAPCENYPDAYYPDDHDQALNALQARQAKALCQGCAVINECFAYATKWDEQGVWGGTTYRARREVKWRARRSQSAEDAPNQVA